MRRIGLFAAVFAVALVGSVSFSAGANSWQGTWYYYNAEGAQIGKWTAGCGAADGRWGDTSGSNKSFSQGCAVES
ncbi:MULTISPECIES: DUF6289 family protein [unclassified Lysobacter]|uniref:DUF6289 family protein n=1 Tax=unclassified Lysobacter TaxID=2635362 RepID=UPI001BE8A3E4|nr:MULTISPECIES: DUF6289 family protein [unclassified Lysobacter]MBT2748187.1 hypothetical protein [Lysobacter sp. ISL-42]MBT2751124.1 hypothetical protein [Lysobacter sp. ISL-50]MBT2779911.1 hypothetical protein [Lysobacter sp. ISL-54]MBT2781880.1 hypothetical protein [Lysobacter sp. ISL-52]